MISQIWESRGSFKSLTNWAHFSSARKVRPVRGLSGSILHTSCSAASRSATNVRCSTISNFRIKICHKSIGLSVRRPSKCQWAAHETACPTKNVPDAAFMICSSNTLILVVIKFQTRVGYQSVHFYYKTKPWYKTEEKARLNPVRSLSQNTICF